MQMFLFFSLLLSWTGAFKNKVIVCVGGVVSCATLPQNVRISLVTMQWYNGVIFAVYNYIEIFFYFTCLETKSCFYFLSRLRVVSTYTHAH